MAVGDDDTVAGTVPGLAVAQDRSAANELIAGRYRILRWLGGGGMGRVYEALDLELGERVALKMLRSGLSDEAITRFRREVRVTRRIQHPNVARMFDIGEHAGEKFLTMELVDGEPLRGGTQRLTWPRLQRLAVQICDGLAAAHRAGVVHRDLKPENVLLERETDRAVITDFGIARSADDAGVTQVGVVVGTPRYMAPEQLAGAADIDARADVFSLGVMLYELASGTRPWAADSLIAIAVAQATQAPRPLAAPQVPTELADIVMSCLAIDPARRPSDAAAIGAAIGALDATSTGRASRPTLAPLAAAPVPTPPPATRTSVAVLPFGCAPGDEHLADCVQQDLTDTLTNASVRVRPPAAAPRTDRDARELGRTLDVEHVVDGSVRRTARGLRVRACLISVADGFQICAHHADCTEPELLAASEQLGRALTDALSTRGATVVRPTDPRAVTLYLRARVELNRFWGEHALRATELLEEAVTYAPTYPPLLAALALASTQLWVRGSDPAQMPRARAHLERALATGHGEAHLAKALFHTNLDEPELGAAELARALVLAPMSNPVHELTARLLTELGASGDARRHFETATGLDPSRTSIVAMDLARLDAFAGDWDSARCRIDTMYADDNESVRQMASLAGSRIAVWRNDPQGAIAEIARLGAHGPIGNRIATLRRWLSEGKIDDETWDAVFAGNFEPARPRRMQLLMLQRLIEIAACLGDHERVRERFDRVAAFGLFDVEWLERVPVLQALRDDPRAQGARAVVAARAARVLAACRAVIGEPTRA